MKKFILGLCLLFLAGCTEELVFDNYKVIEIHAHGPDRYNAQIYSIHIERTGNVNDRFLFVSFICQRTLHLEIGQIIGITTRRKKDSDGKIYHESVYDANTDIGRNLKYCK